MVRQDGGGGRSIFCRGLCRGAAALALAWAAFVLCSGQLPNAWASLERSWGASEPMLLRVCSRGPRGQRRQSLIALASLLSQRAGSASRARVLGPGLRFPLDMQ